MEEIVYEVIGGAIILGIILLVIGVFRTGTNNIRDSVKTQSQAEDVRMEELVGVTGGTYSGGKVKEAFSYASIATQYCEVYVKNGGSIARILNQSTADTYINNGQKYKLYIGYYDETTSATPNINDDHFKATAKQSDKIVMIRFVFVKQ